MDTGPAYVLLIEDDEDDYILTRELLAELGSERFTLHWESSYQAGYAALLDGEFDVCLLDFRLGEETGLDLLQRAVESGCQTPVILLTGQNNREVDLEAMRWGAADYLVKSEISAPLLERSIRYAVERQRLIEQIHVLSLSDELTGLRNRRGFFAQAEQQLELARRKQAEQLVIFADLDGMKQINDRLGHEAGDRALVETATLLRRTFRNTDVIARLGGDEFVVLAIDADVTAAARILERLRSNLQEHNSGRDPQYPIEMSTGFACWSPNDQRTLDRLLAEADARMYEQKQAKQRSAPPLATV